MQKFHLAWDDSRHTLGIASIDSQHRGLMDMINALAEAVAHDCDCEQARRHMANIICDCKQARRHMANIIRFTEEHFAHEEDLMRRHDFPNREKHAAEHKEVLRQAVTMMEAIKPDDIGRAVLVTAFLTDCAENHILREDKALALYLLGKGLS
ncbi:MAG: hemerythrin domain-containing protein [Sulfurimicrobium sp.]|nr:hemerythrin domain-containing protein [Sulfurimicrobium sp.]